jgi:biotin transport system substrate-specific component
MNDTTQTLIRCAVFLALTVVGAWVRIPLLTIPFTLQTFFVLLSGLILGKTYASLTMICYLVLGLFGLPIFSQGGGFGYLVSPTFGYLIGFVAAGWVTGKLATGGYLKAAFVGLGVIYLFGTAYYYLLATLYLNQSVAIQTLLASCVFATLPMDCLLTVLAASLGKRLKKVLD